MSDTMMVEEQPEDTPPASTISDLDMMLASTAHRSLYDVETVVEFMSRDEFNTSEAQEVVAEYRNHPRGPSYENFVSANLVMDLCLDLRKVLVDERISRKAKGAAG